MKKIFSAFLLMTMMVASVGSFVSCSDIEESIAAVDEATKNNADAVEALKSEVAALKTALATAQADAAAAKAEANAAKQAAATAKAEAIAAALAEIEKVNGDVDAMQAVIDSINAALTGKADKATVELLQATLDEYKALNDAAVAENATAIAALEEALAALGENVTPEQLAEVVAKMEAIDAALIAFQSRIQSVAYVPQSMTAPAATQFTVGKEKTDYIIQLAYQVSPVSAAAELENADVYFKGIAVKAEAPAKFETKVLSVDEKTGMVEAVAYIPEEVVKEAEAEGVVIALAIENENGVEITSTYEKFETAPVTLADYVTIKDFDAANEYVYSMPYDTPIADSKVDMINPEFIVNVEGMFEETPLAEALEYLGLEDVTVERTPANRFGTEYIKIENNSLYDNNATPTAATTDDLKVLKDTQSADKKDVTVEFSEDYAKVADATKLIGKNVVVTLKEGFFTIAGDKLPKAKITYMVDSKKVPVTIDIEDIESPWIPLAKFIDVPYSGVAQADFNECHNTAKMEVVDAYGKPVNMPLTITATSHDDLVVELGEGFEWPKETTTYTVTNEFVGNMNDKTKTQPLYSYEFTITLEGRPEDVEYEYAPATLPNLTLVVGPNPNDPSDTNGQTLLSKLNLGAFATTLAGDYASYYEENELVGDIADELMKATTVWTIKEFDVDTDEVAAGDGITFTTNAPVFVYDETTTTPKTEASYIKFPYDVDNYRALSEFDAIELTTEITLNGVKYTISIKATVTGWATAEPCIVAGTLSPKFQGAQPIYYTFDNLRVVYVKDENGKDKLDKDGNKIIDWYTTVISFKQAPTNYVLPQKFEFSDYITIKNVANEANYYVRWSVAPVKGIHYVEKTVGTTKTYITRGTVSEDNPIAIVDYPKYVVDGTSIPTFEFNTAANAAPVVTTGKVDLNKAWNGSRYVGVSLANINVCSLDWNNSVLTSCIVKFELVDKTKPAKNAPANSVEYDNPAHYPAVSSVNVEFKTPATIKSVDATDIEVKWNEATANFAAGVAVTDMFDMPVYNQGVDRTVNTFWHSFAYNAEITSENNTEATDELLTAAYKTGSHADYLKVYKQSIEFVPFDHDGLKSTGDVWISNNRELANGTYASGKVTAEYYEFNTQTGEFKWTSTTAPKEDVTFTARVAVRHMNDNGNPIYEYVNIVVKK